MHIKQVIKYEVGIKTFDAEEEAEKYVSEKKFSFELDEFFGNNGLFCYDELRFDSSEDLISGLGRGGYKIIKENEDE